MTDADIKSIAKVLDEKLKPLHGELARVRSEMSDLKTDSFLGQGELSRIGKDIARIDSSLDSINETLDDHTKLLKSHDKNINHVLWDQMTKVMVELEDLKEILVNHTKILKGIDEKVENNSDDIRKLNKRTTVTESHLGIVSPPELTVI